MIYPMDLMEFESKFGTEKSCQDYLFGLKFKDGFICEKCGCTEYWITKEYVYMCKKCRNHTHLTSNTIFQDAHKPLSMWWITSQKNGTSALGLQRILGIGSYKTAWTWLHKLRVAMVRPERDKLKGIDEYTFRFNRRESASRGMLFYRLVEQAADIEPTVYRDIADRKSA